jgi:cob(I)alamin adenosyltransferase
MCDTQQSSKEKKHLHLGDGGETILIHGEKVSKDDPRLHAIGTLDEMNSFIGLALAHGVPKKLENYATRLQRLTFDIGTLVVCGCKKDRQNIETGIVSEIDDMLDALSTELPELHHFVIPGGTPGAAAFHVARTVCRRAERYIVAVQSTQLIPKDVYAAVNRMSTLLFALARACNCMESGKEEEIE